MKICHFVESESYINGGIKTSVRHQRKAMQKEGISYTVDPTEDYDILHLNVLGPKSLYQFRKAKKNSTPVIVHAHTTGEDFRNSWRFSNVLAPVVDRYTTAIYRKADIVIAPSQYTKNQLQEKTGKQEIVVVSNGIDTDRLESTVTYPVDREDRHVVNLGIALERKGIRDFVATGEQFQEMQFSWFGPHLHWLLAPRRTQKIIENAPENVSFPGYIDNITDVFKKGDIFFFPTHEENEGISLLEAAYSGCPIVVRDIPTYDGWWEHGTHCLKGDSVQEFATHINRLQNDPELYHRLGKQAHELAERYNLQRVGRALRHTYETVRDPSISKVPQRQELLSH